MIEVTEEMRKAAYAVMDGRCPTCNTSLEAKGPGLVEEEGELFLFCPVCGWTEPDPCREAMAAIADKAIQVTA